jgi:hypothetical protein
MNIEDRIELLFNLQKEEYKKIRERFEFISKITLLELSELLKNGETDYECQYTLGLYYEGKNEYKQSFEWFLKAAAHQNSDNAKKEVAHYLKKGLGVRRDPISAWKWLKKLDNPTIVFHEKHLSFLRRNAFDTVICFLCIKKYCKNSILNSLNNELVNLIAWDILQTRETNPYIWISIASKRGLK